jgi:hypothetical protein
MIKHLTKMDLKDIIDLAGLRDEAEKGSGNIITLGSAEADKIISDILYKDRPECAALVKRISQLSSEAMAELLAIMLIGRGDAKAVDFDKLVSRAINERHSNTDYYIGSKKPISKYINNGLQKLGI